MLSNLTRVIGSGTKHNVATFGKRFIASVVKPIVVPDDETVVEPNDMSDETVVEPNDMSDETVVEPNDMSDVTQLPSKMRFVLPLATVTSVGIATYALISGSVHLDTVMDMFTITTPHDTIGSIPGTVEPTNVPVELTNVPAESVVSVESTTSVPVATSAMTDQHFLNNVTNHVDTVLYSVLGAYTSGLTFSYMSDAYNKGKVALYEHREKNGISSRAGELESVYFGCRSASLWNAVFWPADLTRRIIPSFVLYMNPSPSTEKKTKSK